MYPVVVKKCNRMNQDASARYISKLTVIKVVGDDWELWRMKLEIAIGQLIVAAMPSDYFRFFAPVEESCEASMVELEKNDKVHLEYCHVNAIKDELERFTAAGATVQTHMHTMNMRYVGRLNFQQYFARLKAEGKSATELFRRALASHQHLLEAASRLLTLQPAVVHLDLTNNNILHSAALDLPIIVDFGLAFRHAPTATGKVEDLAKVFYRYFTSHPPWPAELVVINFLLHEVVPQQKQPPRPKAALTDQVVFEALKSIPVTVALSARVLGAVQRVLAENPLFTRGGNFLPVEGRSVKLEAFRQNWAAFLNVYVGKSSCLDLYLRLVDEFSSWDNYGLAAMFLQLSAQIGAKSPAFLPKMDTLKVYRDILLELVFYCPGAAAAKRPSAPETLKRLITLTMPQTPTTLPPPPPPPPPR